MINYDNFKMKENDNFKMKENEIVTAQLKLKELTEDVLYQVKKIETLKKELRELFELNLVEQLLGIELQTDGM